MDIDSEASPPSSSPSGRDREPPKTKGTCDRCALSKVKCDRSKPHCIRCVTIGQDLSIPPPCHYTVSLRSLKRKNGRTTSKRTTNGRARSSTESTATPPTPELRPLDWKTTPSPLLGRESPIDLASEVGSATPPAFNNVHLPTHIRQTKSEPNGPFGFMSLSTSAPAVYPHPLQRPSQQCPSASMNRTGSLDREFPASNRGSGCTSLIHSCVEDMLRMQNLKCYFVSRTPSAISLDQLLNNNRKVIDIFETSMACRCSEASDSAFAKTHLLTSAFSFFRNAVDSLMPIAPNPSLSDGSGKKHCKLSILRSELEKISKLADDFNSRYCQSGMGDVVQCQLFKYSLNMELKKCLDALDERNGGSS